MKWAERADLIVLGRVEEVIYRTWAVEGNARREAYARVVVVEAFKGVSSETEILVDLDHPSDCTADLEVLDTYLIFASGSGPNARARTNLCWSFRYKTIQHALPEYYQQLEETVAPMLQVLREKY